jgi:hypothetical protein
LGRLFVFGIVLLRKSRDKGTILKIAFCFALLLALTVVTYGQAEDYYIYQDPEGKLVLSNKEPPPGSKIIKRLPEVTDREVPQAQVPGKTEPSEQKEGSPKPSKSK